MHKYSISILTVITILIIVIGFSIKGVQREEDRRIRY